MNAYDFEYDGRNLSDMGFVICNFDQSDNFDNVPIGSQITFNTSPVLRGARHELLSTSYDDCLETTFQICKNPCTYEEMQITRTELRYLMKWLNRKEFHKLKLFDVDYEGLYFEGGFNVSKIELNDKLYGLELTFTTNRPWALLERSPITINNQDDNGEFSITDVSDEEGFIYPHMEIEIKKSGDFTMHNTLENRTMSIKNCVENEVITLDYPVIHTSIPSHKINNDFNWTFFRIANTFKTGKNVVKVSLPCSIKVSYSPIVKLGF